MCDEINKDYNFLISNDELNAKYSSVKNEFNFNQSLNYNSFSFDNNERILSRFLLNSNFLNIQRNIFGINNN